MKKMYICFDGTAVNLMEIQSISDIEPFSEEGVWNTYGGTTQYQKTGLRFSVVYHNEKKVDIVGEEKVLAEQRQALLQAWQKQQAGG